MSVNESSPRAVRTLVLFPGALGDAVCAEPAVSRLAAEGPVVLYARAAAAEVAVLFPGRPVVRSLDSPEVASLYAPLDARSEEDAGLAWLARYDRVRSFTGAASPEVRARAARHPDARVVPFPPRDSEVHASDLFLRGALDDPEASAPPPRLLLGAAVPRPPVPRLVLHPGSGGRHKRVPDVVFRELARRWRERGGDVEVLLGPAERGEATAWHGVALPVREPADVRGLAQAVAAATAFVGHDSGPSHVAGALGVPTVVLFAATAPFAFGPRGSSVVSLDVRAAPQDARAIAALVWRALSRHLP